MQKETIVVIIIVVLIILANIMTQKYTIKTITSLNNNLDDLKTEINEAGRENINIENVQNKIKKIKDEWQEYHSMLAYYIEHDELEKVETDIVTIDSNIQTNNYDDAISKIEEGKFILKHIQEKYAFSLENVF